MGTQMAAAAILGVVIMVVASEAKAATNKAVHVSVTAPWAAAPLLLEASEFFQGDQFWKYAEAIKPNMITKSDKEQHGAALEASKKILSPAQQALFRLAVSVHNYSPKLQLYKELWSTAAKAGCIIGSPGDAVALVNGKCVNRADAVMEAVQTCSKSSSKVNAEVFEFDHVMKSGDPEVTVVLYASIGSAAFQAFHAVLAAAAKKGDIAYVLRHAWPNQGKELSGPGMELQGYGVELAIKNMEYKAVDDRQKEGGAEDSGDFEEEMELDGFDFKILTQRKPQLDIQLRSFREALLSDLHKGDSSEIKVWALKDLGVQASQRILQSDEPLRLIRDLSHNLPTLVSSVSRMRVNPEIKAELERNRQIVNPGTNKLNVNGRPIDLDDDLNPFRLIDILRAETELMDKIMSLGFDDKSARKLILAPLGPADPYNPPVFKMDLREEEHLFWVNNLESDPQYNDWPRSLEALLQRGWPGQLRYVARNLYTVILTLDLDHPRSLPLFSEIMSSVDQNFPARFGVIFKSSKIPTPGTEEQDETTLSEGMILYRLFIGLERNHGRKAGFDFLRQFQDKHSAQPELSRSSVRKDVFKSVTKVHRAVYKGEDGKYVKAKYKSSLNNTESDKRLRGSSALVEGAGLPMDEPMALVNGKILPGVGETEIFYEVQNQMMQLQRMVYSGRIDGNKDIYEQLIKGSGTYKRFHKLIVPGASSSKQRLALSTEHRTALRTHPKHPTVCGDQESMRPITHMVAVDLASSCGPTLLLEALKAMADDQAKYCSKVRFTTLHSGAADSPAAEALVAVQEAFRAYADPKDAKAGMKKVQEVAEQALKVLKEGSAISGSAELSRLVAAGKTSVGKGEALSGAQQAALVKEAMGLSEGQCAVSTSGRVFGVSEDSPFIAADFGLAAAAENNDKVRHITTTMDSASYPTVDADLITSHWLSDLALFASATIEDQRQHRIHRDRLPARWKADLTGIRAGPADSMLQITAFVDPLSKVAQRLAPILMALSSQSAAHLEVFLNPVADASELPLKGYFRYVLQPEMEFDENGKEDTGIIAKFTNLPPTKLLSMNLHPPSAWFVEGYECVHDMDNILLEKLGADEQVLKALYRLDHILVQGHCHDEMESEPPAGLMLQLLAEGGEKPRVVSDTLVMSNLGYFQLKAQPGIFALNIAAGRSSDLYQIKDKDTSDLRSNTTIFISSWEPEALQLGVSKRPDKRHLSLLDSAEGGEGADSGDSYFSWSGLFGGKADEKAVAPSKDDAETVHVFSLASGHLYERFLKIMMTSVTRNTKARVKFWLLRNFLSPQFKQFIPTMAKKVGFDYELVTYKWPSWLHQQTEKQRIIWGYKILMLDVLFPLSVPKIIYIDSDQVVRADVLELWNMDLKGRPYAYTPFCDNKKEIDGFRFWKQGFWSNHLGNRPYHISALYVVDLQRFRAVGAGDQLRVIYSQLSRDPNSLANLDQDLPNYAQHQVPIFSLPQDWLWCETWCSNSSITTAKTIDLCNNPMTKEPKLDQARRIVSEWVELDESVSKLEETCTGE